MDDKFLKYSKLYGYIFFALFAFVIAVALLIATFYGFSKILSSRPVDVAFELIVIAIPAIVFSTAYIIFFKRTKSHPNKVVKYISYVLFIAALAYCSIGLIWTTKDYFNLIDDNLIIIPNFAEHPINDRFAIGNPHVMQIYGERYTSAYKYSLENQLHTESFLNDYLIKNNIKK